MATPIGHALAGLMVGRTALGERRGDSLLLAFSAALAVAPDLDFLPGVLVGMPALYHQGVSHSLIFALGSGLLVALALSLLGRPLVATWMVLTSSYLSHLVVDLFGPDGRPPLGIPLFWPLTEKAFQSPVTLFPKIRHASTTETGTIEWIATILQEGNLTTLLIEIAILGSLLVLAERRLKRMP